MRKPIAYRASSHHKTQAEAEARAKQIVSNRRGGKVVVEDLDGTLREIIRDDDGSWRESGDGPLESDIAIPPGELLSEELEARGMTQRDLAKRMGRSPKVISEIVRGRKAITPRTAIEIENALRIPATIWVGLEAQYRLALARQDVA